MSRNIFSILFLSVALVACNKSGSGQPTGPGAPIEYGGAAGAGEAGQYGGTAGIGDAMSGTLLAQDVPQGSQSEMVSVVGDRVFFGFNSATISANGQETLKRQADFLRYHPALTITIEGHADERGTREYNLAIGERRANAVKNYLTSLGVTANRISTISYGKEHPEYIGSNEAAWSKNRRAVSVIN